jgi:hypothetical protein
MNPTVAAPPDELDVLSCLAVSFELCPTRVPELGTQLSSEIKRLDGQGMK